MAALLTHLPRTLSALGCGTSGRTISYVRSPHRTARLVCAASGSPSDPQPAGPVTPLQALQGASGARRGSFYGGLKFKQEEEDKGPQFVHSKCPDCDGRGSCTCKDCSGTGRLKRGGYNKKNRVDLTRILGGGR